MRLERDGDLTDFGHALFWGVFGVFLDNALLFDGLCPVFLEKAIADPFVARARERFGQDATVAVIS